MKTDYRDNVDTGIGSFLLEVGKEVLTQTTGMEFPEEEKKSVMENTWTGYADAINSAIDQQISLDQELQRCDIDLASNLANPFDFENNIGESS